LRAATLGLPSPPPASPYSSARRRPRWRRRRRAQTPRSPRRRRGAAGTSRLRRARHAHDTPTACPEGLTLPAAAPLTEPQAPDAPPNGACPAAGRVAPAAGAAAVSSRSVDIEAFGAAAAAPPPPPVKLAVAAAPDGAGAEPEQPPARSACGKVEVREGVGGGAAELFSGPFPPPALLRAASERVLQATTPSRSSNAPRGSSTLPRRASTQRLWRSWSARRRRRRSRRTSRRAVGVSRTCRGRVADVWPHVRNTPTAR